MTASLNLVAGWSCFLGGAISGAVMGLCFHREDWLGGYASFARRLLRLGHIAFFGLGLINILYALSVAGLPATPWLEGGGHCLLIGAATMPTICFLAAWRAAFRHLFFIPVGCTSLGIAGLLVSLLQS
ncbi:MAG TPA: hypothetical protein VGD81_00265 [Opitutaceae bacterium]